MELRYYKVAPASTSYHAADPLTYHSSENLLDGSIIKIKIRNQESEAIVLGQTKKPDFKTNSLITVEHPERLDKTRLSLLLWMLQFYPGNIGPTTQLFYSKLLKLKTDFSQNIDVKKSPQISKTTLENSLTLEQTSVVETIINSAEQTFLLHGETGSGKTRVYIELAITALSKEASSLILVPEIALTPQLVNQFRSVFQDRVLLFHSAQTTKQRRLTLQTLLQNPSVPFVIIGPRSALFLPIDRLGLIVVDEFHDTAYRQESAPYYSAIRVASRLASLQDAKLIFGSATPSINEYYLAKQKHIPILRMTKQARKNNSADGIARRIIIDMTTKQEMTSHPLLSSSLIKELRKTLDKKEQSLVFLNKRGSARNILCSSCGWQSICQNCDLALTYHQDQHSLRCHTCGYRASAPQKCPECSSSEILFKSPGTKSIVASLEKLFPDANIARFDRDNKKSERIESRHQEVHTGQIDILVGTQLLIKGHDLPKLGLVAMLIAESALNFPDYTAEERSYQTIRQLSGRVNRGHRPGTVVIQSFNPKNATLHYALEGRWDDFYNRQILERKNYGFPPFFHVMKVEVNRASQKSAQAAIVKLCDFVQKNSSSVVIIGPSPSFIERQGNKWSWQCIIKSKNRSELIRLATILPGSNIVQLDPISLL